MSNLQIGLVVVGSVVLVALIVHGVWVTRKNTPRQPVRDRKNTKKSANNPAEDNTTQPQLDEADKLDALNSLPPPAPHSILPRSTGLDYLLDAVATVMLKSESMTVSGDVAMVAMPSTRRVGSKPFAIEGQNVATGEWETVVSGHRYREFQAGVQLANRTGPLNEIEYSEFVAKTQAFADALGANVEFSDMLQEVARARDLDQFANSHDAVLNLSLHAARVAWSLGYVQQTATNLGFVAGALPGCMVLPHSETDPTPMLMLHYDAQAALSEDPANVAVNKVSLQLDVTHIDRHEQPFERMRHVAGQLVEIMDGVVTDDNDQELTMQAMDQIGMELYHLYESLEQRDLSAGSPLAKRLFS